MAKRKPRRAFTKEVKADSPSGRWPGALTTEEREELTRLRREVRTCGWSRVGHRHHLSSRPARAGSIWRSSSISARASPLAGR